MTESTPAKRPPTEYESATNIKETLESILVAFILAFIFRAFVVEAFVIPTGSMAPTLLGAHSRWQCPECGFQFDTNYSPQGNGDDLYVPSKIPGTFNIRCPNCGTKFSQEMASKPAIYFGDRILVLKYQYVVSEPNRWDVVVFRAPVHPDPDRRVVLTAQQEQARLEDYSQNFIKRLIALPGDTVMVLDGDVYIKKPNETEFQIQTKPRAAQEALWRPVFDNDFQPSGSGHDDSQWKQPWELADGTGWDARSRQFTFSNSNGLGTLRFNSEANPKVHSFTDTVAYDQTMAQRQDDSNYYHRDELVESIPRYTVTDVKLDLFYERQSGDGELRLQLSKFDDYFAATLSPTSVKLTRFNRKTGEHQEIGSAPLPDNGGKPRHIEFSNADYQVIVRIDNEDLIVTKPSDYHPDIDAIRSRFLQQRREGTFSEYRNPKPEVAITADKQLARLSHVRLLRDVYYTPTGSNNEKLKTGDPEDWGSLLGPDDFFVMGDNSGLSYDARFWPDPVNLIKNEDLYTDAGRVPRRFMIGKAFFVYWPAGYRPITDDWWGIIPNFGDMRFIH